MTNLSMFQQAQANKTASNQDAGSALDLASHLIGDTAHDLRAPLSSARELAQLIAEGVDGPVSENQKKHLEEVVSRCNDMQRLIDDMLQFESAKTGTPKIHRCWSPPALLPDGIKSIIASKLAERSIGLNWIGFEDNLPLMYADADKLTRFLLNLIGNALHVTPEGGKIDVRTEIARTGDRLRFSVQDHGPGMTAEQVQSFSQRGVSQAGGQGLGLAICRQIASLHFARVGFESEPGTGTRFSLEVPTNGPSSVVNAFATWRESLLTLATPNNTAGQKIRPKRRDASASNMHFLPVDDVMPKHPHALTMLSASGGESLNESTAAEMDHFLQGQCRMHELIYRVENAHWIMLLDMAVGGTDQRIAQIGQAQRSCQDADVRQSAIEWFGPVSLALGTAQDRQRLNEAFVRGSLGINGIQPASDAVESPPLSDVAQRRLEAEVRWITQKFRQRQRDLHRQAEMLRPVGAE